MKKDQLPLAIKINLAKYKAYQLLAEGYEVVPVNQNGTICSQYLEDQRNNPSSYRINSKEQIERYFDDGFYDVAFFHNNKLNHLVPTVRKTEYFFYNLQGRSRRNE